MTCWCQGNCPHIAEPRKLAEEKKPGQARGLLHRALVVAPMCVEANFALGQLLTHDNQAAFAEIHFRRAIEAGGRQGNLLLGLANNLRSQSRIPEAIAAFRDALTLLPTVFVYAGLAGALEQDGQYDEADRVITEARAQFPAAPVLRRTAAVVAAGQKDYPRAISILTAQPGAPEIIPAELLDRGRYRESAGDYAGAWADFMAGKAILRDKQNHVYDAEKMQASFAALCDFAAPARQKYYRPAPALDKGLAAPLFVTGFPRSGTTMLETMLSSHSKIVAGDELGGIAEVITTLPRWTRTPLIYPEVLAATSLGDNSAVPALLRDLYYRKAVERIAANRREPIGKNVKFFTDKMPLNEIHLPLIRLLFGQAAPVRLIRRNPLDVMVSCMGHMMVHGGYYASTPESFAMHYAGAYAVFQAYKRHFTADENLVEIRYEDFVRDQAAQTARVLPAGLKVEPACLAFHENPRHSRTISYRQVKEPLHDRSIGRFRNFLPWIPPAVVEGLKPIIEREGFEL